MTPEVKAKAKEIFNKMYKVDDPLGSYPMCFDTAKQCALIAVKLRLEAYFEYYDIIYGEGSFQYWEQVKEEIENL